ncbi:LysR family transcriptional regulator [Roseibacterium sp. SDUM158016]|uniref:LysR family transcriptional regulator n=1 Tax=Roseicyclus sediminis TaxID=2980997 RepID=UPI0021CE1392|nr:LysR family transcriptional regulator [Roseibacterium sp. SDUM158016]MCU4654289.1 LysR family transcriptional regulator [Roseibacterium sp. SDUM158016]
MGKARQVQLVQVRTLDCIFWHLLPSLAAVTFCTNGNFPHDRCQGADIVIHFFALFFLPRVKGDPMRNAPSLTSLRAFEAVLRHGTLSAAARELCVTPAAISHRLRDLEETCGQPLVIRRKGRFGPTALGQEVAGILGDAFERIRLADARQSRTNETIVHIVAPYSFATLWLAGHLSDFEGRHPEADLRILPSHDPAMEGDADIKIVHSDRKPGDTWKLLFRDVCAVMARPDHPLIKSPPTDLNDVLSGTLVHVGTQHGSVRGAFTWARWREIMGLPAALPALGTHMAAEHLAVDLLQRKDGLGLISLYNAADHLERGLLAIVPGSQVQSDCCYWIKVQDRARGAGSIAGVFADWLHECFEENPTEKSEDPTGLGGNADQAAMVIASGGHDSLGTTAPRPGDR